MKKSITDNTKGAVFVSWCTGCSILHCWPAYEGIEKHEGCIIFLMKNGGYEDISIYACKKKYGDCPKKEEAWLVKPFPTYWLWERVDTQLKLLQ